MEQVRIWEKNQVSTLSDIALHVPNLMGAGLGRWGTMGLQEIEKNRERGQESIGGRNTIFAVRQTRIPGQVLRTGCVTLGK